VEKMSTPSTDAKRDIIGKTSSPEREPNTTRNFYCWFEEGRVVNPFDFLVAEQLKKTLTIGVVTEISAPSDAMSHLTNFVGSDFGKPDSEPYVKRLSSMIAEVNVMRNTGYTEDSREVEVSMPVPGDMRVYFANAEDIRFALGADQIKGEEIPAGVIHQSNGTIAPVSLDSAYLLGPEGAHINASGISGLATKTSYLMFLLLSVRQKLGERAAFLIFNVKQSDLLHIDEQATDLTAEDSHLYDLLEMKSEPFDHVKYFLPRGRSGRPDSDAPPKEYRLYAYSMADVYQRFDLLFADVPDPYFTLDTFNSRVREEWDRTRGELFIQAAPRPRAGGQTQARVRNWEELREVDADLLARAYNLNPMTPPRIKRELTRLTASTLFPNTRSPSEVYLGEEVKKIRPGDVFVFDIARIHSRTQPFVVADVMRSVDELYREGVQKEMPQKLIIFIDELNSIAPAGSSSAIAELVVEIARKGRSRGTILFGAEQFKSEIHEQIVGNSGTHVIGRTGSAEVRRTAYGFLDERTKQNVMGLGKGEVVLSTPTWRSAIKLRFPRPSYLKPG
jgi:uncharacterized protein